MRGRVAGLASATAVLLTAPSAFAAETTVTFNEGQIKFGGSASASSIVDPANPVRMTIDLSDSGSFAFAGGELDFPPVTTQVGPGLTATIDLIPGETISGEYDRSTGELETDPARSTLEAELSTGGSCRVPEIPVFLSTEQSTVFAGDRFDPASVPPRNGAVAGRWEDLPAASGVGCTAFNQFTNGEGGIRFARTSGGPEGGELSAKVGRKQIVYGNKVTFKGRLSDVPSGNAGHQIELLARPYPYDEPASVVARDFTAENGSYKFRARPDFNTRYVVRDASGSGAESKEIRIWVWEKADFNLRVLAGSRATARWTLRFGRDLETDFTKRRMFWYFLKKGSRRMTLKDKSRIKQKPGQIRARTTVSIPSRGRYRFYLLPCFDEPKGDDGIGKPGRYKCPRKKHPTVGAFRYTP